MDPIARHNFHRDFCAAQAVVQAGVSTSRTKHADAVWEKWTTFTSDLGLDPILSAVQDKIPILQVFAIRVRSGELALNRQNKGVKGRSVEDYIRSIGQTSLAMGTPDPRYTDIGQMDFRLTRMWAAYNKKDPPPNRVKPVPITVLRHIMVIALSGDNTLIQCTADMIVLAFFFLLRPGEYTDSSSETTPFTLADAQLFIGDTRINLVTAPDGELLSATFCTLTFTTQKNGVKGEVIGLSLSGDLSLCPVLCLIRRIIHLRNHGALPNTPLSRCLHKGTFTGVTPSIITETLRAAVTFLGASSLGFLSSDVSARCLRAAGANALLIANVDTDIIRMIGRWKSDVMLRYLHLQAEPIMRDYSRKMLMGGAFTLLPNQLVPMD